MERARVIIVCSRMRSASMERAQGCDSDPLRLRIVLIARWMFLAKGSDHLRLRVAREIFEVGEISGLVFRALKHLGGEP